MKSAMKFFYLANIRMPTEKAHGLQIMQNCEAFAQNNAKLTLFVARRVNTLEMARIADPWAYYGVARNFAIRKIACLDLLQLGPRFGRVAFPIQALSYTLALSIILLFRHADLYYSRDLLTILALSLIKPRRAIGYEVHQLSASWIGRTLQGWCFRHAGTVITITGSLGTEAAKRGAKRVVVAHDGFRIERFDNLPDRQTARQTLGLPSRVFVVGYAGRLRTLDMSKGIDTLIAAISRLKDRPIMLCLVGGPDEAAEKLRAYWLSLGLPADLFCYVGHVAPSAVPAYLVAFDVCAMPSANTEFFAHQASPLKLFEYMAAGGTILGSDLPAMREVVHDGETAILVTPGDDVQLAAALAQLYDDPALRARLGATAQQESASYSWQARTKRILSKLSEQDHA